MSDPYIDKVNGEIVCPCGHRVFLETNNDDPSAQAQTTLRVCTHCGRRYKIRAAIREFPVWPTSLRMLCKRCGEGWLSGSIYERLTCDRCGYTTHITADIYHSAEGPHVSVPTDLVDRDGEGEAQDPS